MEHLINIENNKHRLEKVIVELKTIRDDIDCLREDIREIKKILNINRIIEPMQEEEPSGWWFSQPFQSHFTDQ
tara:strand:+ start:1194 stop:1412 length:219 start_codon:yes stop_codon:yes gene_type:complete